MSAEIANIYMTGAGEWAERAEPDARADQLAALVARARAGDPAAFESIMLATERKVVATAWRLLGDREEARDAAQEVYLRVFKYLGRFREGEDFQAWLYRITVNVCRDQARRRHAASTDQLDAGEAERALAASHTTDGEAEGATLRAQQLSMLRRALASLPEKERAAVVLRDLEGFSTDEVARLLGSRPATVRSQVSTARVKLKDYCERLLHRKGGAA